MEKFVTNSRYETSDIATKELDGGGAAKVDDSASRIAEAKALNSVLITENAVYDFEKSATKSFSARRIGETLTTAAAVPSNWFAAVTGSRGSNTATSRSKDNNGNNWPIDKIAAKVRAYVNGALEASGTDSQTNASYAGKKVTYDAIIGTVWEAYGNHTFEESGYVSFYPETYLS